MRPVLVAICIGLALYAGAMLLYMAQVRGWVGGARRVTCTVTETWTAPGCLGQTAYYVRWTTPRGVAARISQLAISRARWQRLAVGKRLELVLTPDNVLHLRRDRFDSNLRFALFG